MAIDEKTGLVRFAKLTKEEDELVDDIICRERALWRHANQEIEDTLPDRLTVYMDICAVHEQMPLDLEALLAFPEFDFMHDMSGIRHHINRKTGELGGCFVPRCVRPEVPDDEG